MEVFFGLSKTELMYDGKCESLSPIVPSYSHKVTKMAIECRFFNRGFCNKTNDSCPFLHIKKSVPETCHANSIQQNNNSDLEISKRNNSTQLCVFFFRGKCKAKACQFLHTLPEVDFSKYDGPKVHAEKEDLKWVHICVI